MTSSQILFLSLLKSGLWDTPLDMKLDWAGADWEAIEALAISQTVVGVMMDGLVKLPEELRPPRQLFFKLLLTVKEIERKNESVSKVASKIFEFLNANNNVPLLLKGQGLAEFYPQPKHRMSGDIDLLVGFEDSDYEHTTNIIKPLASRMGKEDRARKHVDYTVMGEVVEIHGSIKSTISKKCDNNIDEWAKERLAADNVIIETAQGNMVTPPINFNALYVFIHFLNHYMNGGIGLRHVMDWMMFLHVNKGKIDFDMLKQDIERLGLIKFWRMFVSIAVVYLGYPAGEMPLYSDTYNKRCKRVLQHIFNTGNFGIKQKAWQYSHKTSRTKRKMITFVGQIPVYFENFKVFPRETLYCFGKYLKDGVNDI